VQFSRSAKTGQLIVWFSIIILPEFGTISHVIAHRAYKKEPFGSIGIIYAIIKIAIIGFIV